MDADAIGVRRRLVLSLAAPLLATGLAAYLLAGGCVAKDASRGGKPRVALVMKSLANEFFKTMEDGARAHHASHRNEYDLVANGIKDEKDVAGQIALVEQMIAQQVDALVIAPADSKALVPICKRAMDAGIVVVNIDNKFNAATLADKGIAIPFVGPDNRRGARLAAEHLATRLAAGDKVAIVEGAPNAYNGIQRKLGFEDAMKAVGAEVVSSQSGRWMTDDAEKVVAGMITQHPETKAVLCANDNMALGAVAALKAAGKLDQVLVIGYDNISAVQSRIRDGTIFCTIDQHADRIAVYGIQYALEILERKAVPLDKETPVDLITAESLR
jgi:ribose transport system substrate-binding protein